MTKNNGIDLGNNKIMVDSEGSLHVSHSDNVRKDIDWAKVATTKNDLFERLVLGETIAHEKRLEFYEKTPNNLEVNTSLSYHNNSINDTKVGLLVPNEFSSELPATAYRKIESRDDSVYVVKTTQSGKIPQISSLFSLVDAAETYYEGIDIWKVYGAIATNPGSTTPEYAIEDKVSILKQIIKEIRYISVGKSSSSYTGRVYTGSGYSGRVASHSDSFLNKIELTVSSDMKLVIQSNGYISFLTHGEASDGTTEQSLSIDYTACYIKFNVSMSDIYLSKYNLDNTLREIDRPAITMSNEPVDDDALKEGDLHIVYVGNMSPSYGVILLNGTTDPDSAIGTNSEFYVKDLGEVDQEEFPSSRSLSRIIYTNGTGDIGYINDETRLYVQRGSEV